jgi:hypothetical protein
MTKIIQLLIISATIILVSGDAQGSGFYLFMVPLAYFLSLWARS